MEKLESQKHTQEFNLGFDSASFDALGLLYEDHQDSKRANPQKTVEQSGEKPGEKSSYILDPQGNVIETLGAYTNTYNSAGELIETRFASGASSTLEWSNGNLSVVKSSDGRVTKFENGEWREYDSNGEATGKKGLTLHNPDGSRCAVTGAVTSEQLSNMSKEKWQTTLERLYGQDSSATIKIDVSEPANPVVRDERGRIVQSSYGEGLKATYSYNENSGDLEHVSLPHGFQLNRSAGKSNWTITDSQGQTRDSGIKEVQVRENGELSFSFNDGSKIIYQLNGDPKGIPARVRPEMTAPIAQGLFEVLDLDKDNRISKMELGQAMQESKFNPHESQVITALYKEFLSISALSDDRDQSSPNKEPEVITRNDVTELGKLMFETSINQTEQWMIEGWMKKNAFSVDENRDGRLTKAELSSARMKTAPGSYDGRVIDLIHSRLHKQSYENPLKGFTLDVLELTGQKKAPQFDLSPDGITRSMKTDLFNRIVITEEQVSQQAHREPNTKPFEIPEEAGNFMQVKQGPRGDCYLLASIAATCASRPDLIQNMVKHNGDGSYTVSFHGVEPIKVQPRTLQQMALGAAGSSKGDFVGIIEDAYGILDARIKTDQYNDDPITPPIIPVEGVSHGGYIETALKYLTGMKYTESSIRWMSESGLKGVLDKYAAGDNKSPLGLSKLKSEADDDTSFFAAPHAYAIVKWDPECKPGGSVTVMNPWGTARVFTLAQIKKHFQTITVPESK